MPPKRKTVFVDLSQVTPQKRRTRSSGAVELESLPLLGSHRRVRSNKPQIASPPRRPPDNGPSVPAANETKAPEDDDELLLSPSKRRSRGRLSSPSVTQNAIPLTTPHVSPSKKAKVHHGSPSRLFQTLPQHLHSCLQDQKSVALRALQNPSNICASDDDQGDEAPTNDIAFQQLTDLLTGSVERGEGNSCLLLGPRGSGKTRLVEHCLTTLSEPPIILRLSGWAQDSDRLAMREIAFQVSQQAGTSLLSKEDNHTSTADEDTNPFFDGDTKMTLPPSSHLPQLISVLPTLPRPTVVVLDGFDLFALHPRQSLLYCLLDTVQSCRVAHGNKGIAVIGISSRVDTINLLEKRVKSRFSGRIFRTAAPRRLKDWIGIARNALCEPIDDDSSEWSEMWHTAVDDFLADSKVVDILNETFALTRDVRMLTRILTTPILELGPASPFPSASSLASAVAIQRFRPRFPHIHSLPYPSICLLIAAMHSQTAGHDILTFEMLYECFRDQVRSSTSAPVQVEGGGIGMVRCSRDVLMTNFEHLHSTGAFVNVAAPSSSVPKEFVRYRCVVEREDIKKAVEKIGQTNLKKWFNKAQ